MSLARVVVAAAGTGVAGWLLENLLVRRFDSPVFPGVPFLPTYAAGGLVIALLEPHLRALPLAERFLVYAIVLAGVESTAGAVDHAQGFRSWDYGDGKRTDVPHALAWGVLGLFVESVLKHTASPQGVDKGTR